MEIKNMNRGVLGRLIAVVAIALCCVVALPAAAYAEDVPEDKTEFHITNRNDFLACVAAVATARHVAVARLSR